MLKINELLKKYGDTTAVNRISIDFPSKGMIFIKGKSGCGKTTLLNLLGGLDSYDSGLIEFNGKDTGSFTKDDWDSYRNCEIAFIFQDYNLIERFSVYENINLALSIQDDARSSYDNDKIIEKTLEYVDLPKDYINRNVKQLSGGQKQRVAIARAVAKNSKIILADEPTGNLDSENSEIILSLLKKVSEERLVIIVSHDVASAYRYGDRVISISDGEIISDELLSGEKKDKTYHISIDADDNTRILSIFESDKESIKEKIAKVVLSGDRDKYIINIETDNDYKDDVQGINSISDNSESDVTPRHLSAKHIFKLSGAYLLNRKFRLISTVFMMSLTLLLLIMVFNIFLYDRCEVIGDYVDVHGVDKLFLSKDHQYTDHLLEIQASTIKSGKAYADDLQTLMPEADLVKKATVDINCLISEDMSESTNGSSLYITDDPKLLDYSLKEGRFPEKGKPEIAVTDYVDEVRLNGVLRKKVNVDNIELEVVGIIKTDYREKQISRKEAAHKLNAIENYYLENFYNSAVVGIDYLELQKKHQDLSIEKSDFSDVERENHYLGSVSYIGARSLPSLSVPSKGRDIQSDNEILVSEEFAEKLSIEGESFDPVHVNFIDIYDTKYNGTYSDFVNLFDLFPEGLEVVGILGCDEYGLDTGYDYVLSDRAFKKIVDTYYDNYWNDSYLISFDRYDPKEAVNIIDSNGYTIEEPIISRIYTFNDNLNELKPVIILVAAVITSISVLMVGLFISNSIKSNQKDIGVLKALGVKTSDVTGVFIAESFVLALFSFVLALIDSFIFIYWINNCYVDQIQGNEISFLYTNWYLCVLVFVIAHILCLLASVLPLRIMSQKKPIEIIRSQN